MEFAPVVRSCSALLVVWLASACGSDGAHSDAAAGSAGASSAGSAGSGGGLDSTIAQWPVPNSPGLGLPNPQNYDAETTPGVVHDIVTGLSWLQAPGDTLYPRAEAVARCDELSFAGFDDWRVPAFVELVSLFNAVPDTADPLAPSYLSPIFEAGGRFWSSSTVNNGLGRLLDFGADGCSATTTCSIGVAAKVEEAVGGAFCVRNSQPFPTSARYAVTGDQVADLRTGLTWITVPAAVQTGDFDDAIGACMAVGNGARLPSITELLSLLLPVLDNRAFPNWPADAFTWSSSSVAAKPGSYWAAAIAGATRADDTTGHNRVQCVR